MILLTLLDIFIVGLLILTVGTQVIVPALAGLPLFPFFRRRRILEGQLAEAREHVAEAGIEIAIDKEKERAAALRKKPADTSVSS